MRSRVLPARAFTRLLTGQQQQQSSSSSTATATASAASSSTNAARLPSRVASSSAFTNARVSRTATASRRRTDSLSVAGSSPLRRRRSTSSRSRPDTSASSSMLVVDPTKVWNFTSEHFSPLKLHGIAPVNPPRTTLTNVALQNFFAAQRPLLEHQVVASSSSSQINLADQDSVPDEETRKRLESISQVLMQSLHKSGRISAQDLDTATVVIAAVDDVSHSPHAKRMEGVEQSRFVKLIDRLAKEGRTEEDTAHLIQAEAERMESEQKHKKDIESAVSNALERGEDPSLAQILGSESDMVILGEPKGPNPAWARGVATHMANATRAYVPPSDVVEAAETDAELIQAQDGTTASIKIIDDREEDPNLILSHAMVQATLPPALSWDRIVAKMDAASMCQSEKQVVDVSALNADLLNRLISQVSLDSTKRKRGKKMRKHKYRKLRKATRIERSRLKK